MPVNKDIEKTQDNKITTQVIENTIPEIINDFCIKNNIEDLRKESSNIFNALMIYINEAIIKPNKKELLIIPNKAHNKYNPDILLELLNIYEKLCLLYDNAITIYGYCLFVGIDRQTFYNMENDKMITTYTNNITGEKFTPSKTTFDIVQKLRDSEEQTTLNCRKYNDLRIIARLNRITGGAYRDYTQVNTADSRQELTHGEIENKYGAIENNGDPAPQLPQ